MESLGSEVVEGIVTIGAGTPENSPSAKACDELYRKIMGTPVSSNFYATMCFDMVNVLALAMQVAGNDATPKSIAASIRTVVNPPGKVVFSYAEGRDALKGGKIKYSGAYSDLKFDESGDDSAALFTWNAYVKGKSSLVKVISLT